MFSKFSLPILSFLVVFFKCLDHFMVFLFVLITFESILDVFVLFCLLLLLLLLLLLCFEALEKSRNPDGGRRWPPFRYDDAIITSCDVITS